MTMISASAAASAAAPLPLGSNPEPATAIFAAAGLLLPRLERGERVDAAKALDWGLVHAIEPPR